jgi:hypothetical protein
MSGRGGACSQVAAMNPDHDLQLGAMSTDAVSLLSVVVSVTYSPGLWLAVA